jgi:hypothetical protein
MELSLQGRKMGATPRWVGYVAVDDLDLTVDRLRQLGGAVYVPPTKTNIAVLRSLPTRRRRLSPWPRS